MEDALINFYRNCMLKNRCQISGHISPVDANTYIDTDETAYKADEIA